MSRKREITPLGWRIKQRLAERQMDQQAFAKSIDIPKSRLSDLITGRRRTHQEKVVKALQLEDHVN